MPRLLDLEMPIERYFLEETLEEGESYHMKGGEFHHLSHVVRARCDDEIELVNGNGILARGAIREVAKDRAKLEVIQRLSAIPYRQQLILAQALSKQNRLDFILEKGTELGVDLFILFSGVRSMKKEFSLHQQERARAIAIAAMKQCGRLFLPKIIVKGDLDQWAVDMPGRLFFGDTDPNAPVFESVFMEGRDDSLPLTFFVGPESGFSQQEEEQMKALGACGVKIHPNILRTDTAGLTALSLMSHWLMRSSH